MPTIDIPSDFLCPITQELMQDPVATADGQIYERKAIEAWLTNHNTSPLTNKALESKNLISIPFVKNHIEAFKKDKNICSFKQLFEYVKSGDFNKLSTLHYVEDYINLIDKESGDSLLHVAAEKNSVDIIELLIKEGANYSLVNSTGETPLHTSARCGALESLKLLYKYDKDIESRDNDELTCLHDAACYDKIQTVQFLIENKANIEAKTSSGETPLMFAVRQGYLNIVNLLLDSNADVAAKNRNNFTSLHIAAKYGHAKVTDLLIKQGADLDSLSASFFPLRSDNQTPLHWAACSGDEETVLTLLRAHAKVNAEDSNNWTPLFVATRFGYEKIMKLLLKYGANHKSKDKDGKTLAEIAKNQDTAKLIPKLYEQVKSEARVALVELQEYKQRIEQLEEKVREISELREHVKQMELKFKELEQVQHK